MFCFFVNLTLGVGEDERLRFVLVVVVVIVVIVFRSAVVEESEEEMEDKLVFAAEGFSTELAWRVTLESLEPWAGLVVTTLAVLVTVGFGGLEKSISEDSLSDEVVSEEEDAEGAFTLVFAAVSVALKDSSSGSLSEDELSEEDSDFASATAIVAAAGLDVSAADSLSDEEVSEEEEGLADGLETGALL